MDAESVSEASRCVAQLRQQLAEMQQGQAALELQLKYTTSASQLAQLQPQLEEQQRSLGQWEGRLGRQLEQIVGSTMSAFDADGDGQLCFQEFRALLSASSTERNKALHF